MTEDDRENGCGEHEVGAATWIDDTIGGWQDVRSKQQKPGKTKSMRRGKQVIPIVYRKKTPMS